MGDRILNRCVVKSLPAEGWASKKLCARLSFWFSWCKKRFYYVHILYATPCNLFYGLLTRSSRITYLIQNFPYFSIYRQRCMSTFHFNTNLYFFTCWCGKKCFVNPIYLFLFLWLSSNYVLFIFHRQL